MGVDPPGWTLFGFEIPDFGKPPFGSHVFSWFTCAFLLAAVSCQGVGGLQNVICLRRAQP